MSWFSRKHEPEPQSEGWGASAIDDVALYLKRQPEYAEYDFAAIRAEVEEYTVMAPNAFICLVMAAQAERMRMERAGGTTNWREVN